MGSQFKGKILEDNMAGILKQWHGDVRKKRKKEEQESQSARTSFSMEWSSVRHSISSYMRPSTSRRAENTDFSNRWDNKEEIVELEESSSRAYRRDSDYETWVIESTSSEFMGGLTACLFLCELWWPLCTQLQGNTSWYSCDRCCALLLPRLFVNWESLLTLFLCIKK